MEGPSRRCFTSLRLTRSAESSRLQLDLIRRAFELVLANNTQCPQPVPRQLRSAAAAAKARTPGV